MTKLTVHKIGGISAILSILFLVPWFAFPKVAPFINIKFPASLEFEQWARFKTEHQNIISTIDWLVIVALFFELVAAVGFFYILRKASALTWFGLAVWFMGLQLIMVEHIIVLAIDVSLMPKYLSANISSQPAIEIITSALNRIRLLAATVGNHLDLGIAVPIFSVISFKLPQIPKWIGWLGIAVGILTWVRFSYWPPPNFIAFAVWMIAMGVTLFRFKPVSVT